MGFERKLLILGFVYALQTSVFGCQNGFQMIGNNCEDIDECKDYPGLCGNNSTCLNTNGSYHCNCLPGFVNSKRKLNFSASEGKCVDINECTEGPPKCTPYGKCSNLLGSYECSCNSGYINNTSQGDCTDIDECKINANICGENGSCKNLNGSYQCLCNAGFTSYGQERTQCSDIDECKINADICGENGSCKNLNGSYQCLCNAGFTSYGQERTRCSELKCDRFSADSNLVKSLGGLADIVAMMRNSCLDLSNMSFGKADGDALLEKLLTATDSVLSSGDVESEDGVSGLLNTMEKAILLIGPQLKANDTKMETKKTEVKIAVRRGLNRPTGPVRLTSEHVHLNTDWTTAAGTGPYPGFALASLLSYKNLERSVNRSFKVMKDFEKDAISFQIFSKVVSVVVSNPSTQNLSSPVNITFRHLQDIKQPPEARYICAYWNEKGVWSPDGCSQELSNDSYTVCSCKHLSSFAVLMALYPMKHTFELQLLTKIGLGISLVCLLLSILTFKFCRSIQGTRTTIHLHLCICLFMADLIFLVGISRTSPKGGCSFVAAMLHFFFLGVMTWMLLEGVQLYRMVVLVFNATIRPLYLYLIGYGVPLGIVIISVMIRSGGYGTEDHCWLSLQHGLIWSFFGPVCFIIILNVFFFIITVWKLAQKFATLNPDLSKLHKIRAFTVTAVAQMCILGLMWVFGAFLFSEGTIALAYIFTILNSLQGALVFIMHCLLSKQVRDEYVQLLSCVCTPQKKRYSDFSSTNPSSSQSQGSRSGQITGESQI